jgi:hypothetical protein
MSELKEYIVLSKYGINISEIEKELTNDTTLDNSIDSNIIPDRSVKIINSRSLSDRTTHFLLTKEEAHKLRKDPRIETVYKFASSPDNGIINSTQYGDFRPAEFSGGGETPLSSSALFTNWTQLFHTVITKGNNFSSYTSSLYNRNIPFLTNYSYSLDGTGVDLIVVDAGFNPFHQDYLKEINVEANSSSFFYNHYLYKGINTYTLKALNNSDPINNGDLIFNISNSVSLVNTAKFSKYDNNGNFINDFSLIQDGTEILFTNKDNNPTACKFIVSGSIKDKSSYYELSLTKGITNFNHPSFGANNLFFDITKLNQSASIFVITQVSKNTKSRVQYINWYHHIGSQKRDPGINNLPSIDRLVFNPYDSISPPEHGSLCLSVAGGLKNGIAKGANLYFLPTNFTTASSFERYSFYDVFGIIKNFHLSKSIDPNTGYKRPTVVSISISLQYDSERAKRQMNDGLTHINQFYYTGSSVGLIGNNNTASLSYGCPQVTSGGKINFGRWEPSIDADADACSDVGVIIVASGGNEYAPLAGTTDINDPYYNEDYASPLWNSYFTFDVDTPEFDAGDPIYYSRSGPPGGGSIILVPQCQIYYVNNLAKPAIRGTMNCGPRIDIAAVCEGLTSISSSLSDKEFATASYFHPSPDIYNSNLVTYTGYGSSFAAPVVAGFACLWAQINPGGNSTQFKKFLKENGNNNLITQNNSTDLGPYILGNDFSALETPIKSIVYRKTGQDMKVLHFPYFSSNQATFSNIQITKT